MDVGFDFIHREFRPERPNCCGLKFRCGMRAFIVLPLLDTPGAREVKILEPRYLFPWSLLRCLTILP